MLHIAVMVLLAVPVLTMKRHMTRDDGISFLPLRLILHQQYRM
jgi:hypothetical protein